MSFDGINNWAGFSAVTAIDYRAADGKSVGAVADVGHFIWTGQVQTVLASHPPSQGADMLVMQTAL